MITTKTKKAFCLSLLLSLTTSVSADDRFDKIKSWITPKTIAATAAIATCASAVIYYYQQNKLVPIRELRFPTTDEHCAWELGIGVQREYLYAPNRLVHDGALQARVQPSSINPGAGQIFSLQDPGEIICNFSCAYSLNHKNEACRWVDINSLRTRRFHFPSASPLAKILYKIHPENTYKEAYAAELLNEITIFQTQAEQTHHTYTKNYLTDMAGALIIKRAQVLESMQPQE